MEGQYPQGLTIEQIQEVLIQIGITCSEATIRGYAQMGIIPQSIRVGRQGKLHGGSFGLYPAISVRAIAATHELMQQGYMLRDIQPTIQRWHQVIALQQRLRSIATVHQEASSIPLHGATLVALRISGETLLEDLGELQRKAQQAVGLTSSLL